MYKRVNWLLWWLVGYVTCGIYGMYVWYQMTKDMNAMAEKAGEKTIMGFIPQLLLGIVTCGIYSLIWMFQFFGLMTRLSDRYNAGITPENTFIKFILAYVPIFSFYWIADSFNKIADKAEA